MSRNPALAADDIRDQIGFLREVTTGTKQQNIEDNQVLRYAIERSIEIISEASRRLLPEWKEATPEVPWDKVANIGNVFRHAYHSVSMDIIWGIITSELDLLEQAMATMPHFE
jgi:uncharacterized protein with HEPN domain